MIYNFKAKLKGKKRHYAPTLSERLQVVPEYCKIHTKSQRTVSSPTAKQVDQLQSTIKVEHATMTLKEGEEEEKKEEQLPLVSMFEK